jgi:amidase
MSHLSLRRNSRRIDSNLLFTGMQTTAGSHALSQTIVPEDSAPIKNLRSAGAIILGKANLSELSGMRGEIDGEWSGRGGYCYSAYVEKGDPSGSSCGSAVAVSAGFAAAALGGDTTGSITFPAGRAACYAMRPSLGLVSTEGCVPMSSTMDVLGPLGKSAYDVALVLGHMVHDPRALAISESSMARYAIIVVFF